MIDELSLPPQDRFCVAQSYACEYDYRGTLSLTPLLYPHAQAGILVDIFLRNQLIP
jgi:hypothetical protein